jgi:hypothetical protein
LYPNPANNFIKIDLDYKSTFTGYVTVFDLLGKALNSYPVNNENTQYDIPTGDLASGIYFIKFTNSHSSETESNPVYRIVVQH